MKPFNSTLFWLPLVVALALLVPRPATADVSVSFDFFQDNLDPYGEWVEIDDYGYCWRPTVVDDGWRPYADGYWAYTDVGWTWVSYEDFGGITYHYGRWFRADECGWVWRPDYEWAPAWVSWRHSDDYIGWAPLPPEARFNRSIGFGFGVDLAFDIGPAYYNFCETSSFGSPALRPVIIDNSQNISIINQTTNVTNITYNNNVIYNGGPNYAALAARTSKPIPTMKLVRQTDAAAMRLAAKNRRFAQAKGDELLVVAPGVKGPKDGKIKPAKVGKKFGKVKVDKGWDGVKDPQEKEKIQAKMKENVKGDPKEVKAKPVDPADIDVVKNKAGKGKNKRTAESQPGRDGETVAQPKKNKDATAASSEDVPKPRDGSEPENGRVGRGQVGKEASKGVKSAPDGSLSPSDETGAADESRKSARKEAGRGENEAATRNKNAEAAQSKKLEKQQRQAEQAQQQQQEAQQAAAAAKAARQREKAQMNGSDKEQRGQGAERGARQTQEAAEAARAARQQQQAQEAAKAARQQQNHDAERAARQQQRQEQAIQQQRAAQQQQQRQDRGVQQQQRQQQAAQQQQRAAQQQQRQQQVAQQQMRQQQVAQQQMRQQQAAQQQMRQQQVSQRQMQQAAGRSQPAAQPGVVQRQGKKKGKHGDEENQQ